jgi:hypothetical protein
MKYGALSRRSVITPFNKNDIILLYYYIEDICLVQCKIGIYFTSEHQKVYFTSGEQNFDKCLPVNELC